MQLLLCCLFGLVLTQVSAVTFPECENVYHETCRTNFRYRSHHDWIPYANGSSENGIKWRVLVDQYDYQNVVGFTFPPSVWKNIDEDGDSRGWVQGSGGTCTYQLRVHTFGNPQSNNWVVSQAVSYCDAVELIVNASVRFSGCLQRPDCHKPYVILHRFDTDSPNENDRANTANYKYFGETEEASQLLQVGENSDTQIIKRFPRPSTSHTYFGIQDVGTTGQVQRFIVYYKVCQNNNVGLVRYPEVPLPPSGSNGVVMRLAHCVPHAHNVTSLETYAYEDRCDQEVKCECDVGYGVSTDLSSCVACEEGFYRTKDNDTCVPCPKNTKGDKVGADICECKEGFFRADHEGAGVKCTAPPSEFQNELRIVSVCDTSVELEWDKPVDVGRSDYDYDISRKNPDNPDESISIEPHYVDHRDVVRYTVTGLAPSTAYTFIVCVHNGVSEHDSANDKLRIITQQATTRQGSVFVLNGVVLPNNSVVLREDIGEGDNALSCQAPECGNVSALPKLFLPANTPVPVRAGSGHTMYSTSARGVAFLNRLESDMSPLGKYSCQITDTLTENVQTIFIKIATIVNADSCPLNPSAPTTTVSATTTTSMATTTTSTATPTTSTATPTSSSAAPPTTTIQDSTTPSPTTPSPTTPSGTGLTFELNGAPIASGSTISVDDIGEGNNALICRTTRTDCCNGANRNGEFFYPNNVEVGIFSAGEAMYRNRGVQLIRLNRNSQSPDSPPTGVYHCVIPDSSGESQSISINIIDDSGITTCPQLKNPANGLVTISTNGNTLIVPGSTAAYTCDDGYRRQGPPSRQCGNDGTWTGTDPTCEVVTCPNLEDPENGRVDVFGNTQGSVATYLCDTGYELESGASSNRVCGGDGQWSGVTPVCEVRCPPLDNPERGLVTVDGDRREGTVAAYSCNGGLAVVGSANRTCQSDGTWSNEAPTCGNIRFQLNGQTYPNGSSLLMSSIGEGDNALWCLTDGDCCTGDNRAGQFYYPDGTAVSIQAATQDGLYRNRGFKIIRLNRRSGATPQTGQYKCQIPDADGQLQNIFINLN